MKWPFRRKKQPKPDPQLPQWALDHVSEVYTLLGLGEWDVYSLAAHRIDDRHAWNRHTDKDMIVAGLTVTSLDYLSADIYLLADLQPNFTGYNAITHEMLHVLQAPQVHAVQEFIESLPRSKRAWARSRWTTANEQTIERLSRTITTLMGVPKEQDTSDDTSCQS